MDYVSFGLALACEAVDRSGGEGDVELAVWGFGWLVGALFVLRGCSRSGRRLHDRAAVLFAVAIGMFVLWALSMGVWP